jgi:hypothetical protein
VGILLRKNQTKVGVGGFCRKLWGGVKWSGRSCRSRWVPGNRLFTQFWGLRVGLVKEGREGINN